MDTVPFSEARIKLTEIVNTAHYHKDRIVITRNGKKFAAIVPVDDLDLLEEMEDSLDARLVKEELKNMKGLISLEDLKEKLGI